MFLSTIIAGATLGEIVGSLIVSVAGLTGTAATSTMATSTAVGLVTGVTVAINENNIV